MTQGTTLRIRVGGGERVPGAHAAMAVRVADWAKLRGFRASIAASRHADSASRYITIQIGPHPWRIRIAGHLHRNGTGHDRPHLDLISRDGVAGEAQAIAFLERVVAGDQPWFDPGRSPCPRSKRRGQRGPKSGGRR